jgi:hypothetical protein
MEYFQKRCKKLLYLPNYRKFMQRVIAITVEPSSFSIATIRRGFTFVAGRALGALVVFHMTSPFVTSFNRLH